MTEKEEQLLTEVSEKMKNDTSPYIDYDTLCVLNFLFIIFLTDLLKATFQKVVVETLKYNYRHSNWYYCDFCYYLSRDC